MLVVQEEFGPVIREQSLPAPRVGGHSPGQGGQPVIVASCRRVDKSVCEHRTGVSHVETFRRSDAQPGLSLRLSRRSCVWQLNLQRVSG